MIRWIPLVVLVCLILTACSGASARVIVTVSTPANNATVTSPVLFSASATSNIKGWSISVDGASVYQTGAASSISTSISMAAGTHQVVIRAWASNGTSGSVTLTETVASSGGSSISITTSSIPGATVGTAYQATLTATGGTPPYTWSVASGSLPTGLNLSSTGVFSGTPTVSGNFAFSVQAKDSASSPQTATRAEAITVATATPTVTPLVLTTTSLPNATVGSAYNATLTASGGTPPYNWSVVSGQLPTGLTLSNTGVLSGTPTASGSFAFSIQVKDSASSPQAATGSENIAVAAGTPSACSGTCYYVSPAGNDANLGTSPSAPWRTIARVIAQEPHLVAGDSVLFERGGIWNEMLTISGLTGTASAPITFSNYGTGNLPVIEGGGTRSVGIIDAAADSSVNPTGQSASSYVTIDGFEIRNALVGGIVFANLPQYGIVVKNNIIHNNGYGAYSGACGGCFGADDGHYGYNEAISMYYYPHDTSHGYKPQILNNRVYQEGGHNAIMVDGAAGDSDGAIISGNIVGPGCSHNCYDYKRSQHVMFSHNTANCEGTVTINGQSYAACNANAFYTEQDDSGYSDSATYEFNVANGAASGYMCYSVHCGSGPNNDVFYNNDCYAGSTGAVAFGTGTSCSASTSSLTFRNNIFDGGSCDSLSGYFTVSSDYNDRFNASGCPIGQHDITSDPQFVNPGSEFHLQLGSPALSSGDSTLGVQQMGACGSSGTCP